MASDRPLHGNTGGYNLNFVDWQNEWERIANEEPELLVWDESTADGCFDKEEFDEVIRGAKKMKIGKSKQVCSICVVEFALNDKIYKLKCTHIFHCDCFEPWVKKNRSCPNCRKNLLEKESV